MFKQKDCCNPDKKIKNKQRNEKCSKDALVKLIKLLIRGDRTDCTDCSDCNDDNDNTDDTERRILIYLNFNYVRYLACGNVETVER